jgi:hypothetical protein
MSSFVVHSVVSASRRAVRLLGGHAASSSSPAPSVGWRRFASSQRQNAQPSAQQQQQQQADSAVTEPLTDDQILQAIDAGTLPAHQLEKVRLCVFARAL